MNKFSEGRVYILIPDSEITQEMINYSTSKTKEAAPSKTINGVLYRILETFEVPRAIYGPYKWYDKQELPQEWLEG